MRRRWSAAAWVAIGIAAPFVLATVLLPFQHRLDNTTVALLLVVSIVAVATCGRRAGAYAAAISSAVAFDLLYTHPFVSLRISASNDLQTDLALLLVGLAVGELAARGRRYQAKADSRRQELQRLHDIAGQVALENTADFVVMNVAMQLAQELGLADCRFELEYHDDRVPPHVDRGGVVWWGPNVWDTRRWGLPPWGVELPVWGHGRQIGRFILVPQDARSVEVDALVNAVALADQAGAALAASSAVT